ncbi:MAG: sugar phosphate isomerase/epimerase family protein [Candidatus Poribacteria bacterium]|jgi:sugar phosphate isomerase/epimerase|nr:sugar phosphate isomerase/epimerase family protein [Candidatus Poribacteria bacterium]MDP6745444.1 sugar phosphate isomerase/epimerase family protein [Candidatus Poribacteria bacterium]MDP6995285.1 sugar phosphate isomerase/epimerase family protein [Candidatus Poribacteria bacterium]
MKVGIRDGMLGLPLEETFQKAKSIGFSGLEICIGADYRNHPIWQEGGIDQLNAWSETYQIEICSLSPGGFTAFSFANPVDSIRTEGIAMLQRLAEVAPDLGATVILVPFFGNGQIKPEDLQSGRFLDGWKMAAETADKSEVYFGIESTVSAEDHLSIIDRVGSSRIGVYYDMGNATSIGYDSPSEIQQLGNAIVQMHIKDTGGNHAGEGEVDFDAVFSASNAIGYNGWWVLETPGNDERIASAEKNMNFVCQNA